MEQATLRADWERAARLKYEIGQLEQQLAEAEQALRERGQNGRALVKEEVDEQDIAEVVSRWTGIPVSRLMEGEVEKLIQMEERLRERVVGQDEAIAAVANAVRAAGPACRTRTGRSAASCSSARPASARPRRPARWPSSCSTTSRRWSAST